MDQPVATTAAATEVAFITSTFTYRLLGRCASPPVWGCYELDDNEADSDNESRRTESDNDEEEPVNIVLGEVDPASIPLPPSPAPSTIAIDAEPSQQQPTQPTDSADVPATTTTTAITVDDSPQETPIIVDAVPVTLSDSAPIEQQGAAATNDSLPTDAQLGDTNGAQHPVLDHLIDIKHCSPSHSPVLLPRPDEEVKPEPEINGILTKTEEPIINDIVLPDATNDDDKTEGSIKCGEKEDEPKDGGGDTPDEACSTDCGRPTTKLDKGKGREIVLDSSIISTDESPITVDAAVTEQAETVSPPMSNDEQLNEPVCTPPTPSSRTRRSRRDRERHRSPKYQPILTIRSSQGWLWNQDLFIPHYMKDRYTTYPPDPYHGHPSAHPNSHNTSANGSITPSVDFDCVAISLTAEDMEAVVPP